MKITFSFGRNWRNFVDTVDEENIESAKQNIAEWIGDDNIKGKTVLDIGSGSGIHSYCFHKMGASSLFSFDYDPYSVESTELFRKKAGSPASWMTTQGSVLDKVFLNKISPSDIVYSWGVLHHTGDMWTAIDNASQLVKNNGLFFISIYAKGPKYPQDLATKQKYNASGWLGKKWMTWQYIWKNIMFKKIRKLQNPFGWNKKKERGMDVYHDIIDWLGGLPYEVASEEEITQFLLPKGFTLKKKLLKSEGSCHRLLYIKE
jgi:SAM-dependent methyltransferase